MKLFNFLILVSFISATIAADNTTSTTQTTTEEVVLTTGPVTCEYKTKDINTDYDENTDTKITCGGSSCSVSGSGASFANSILSITAAGTYIVGGSLDGQIKINATENDFIHLVLNSAIITSSDGPAIYGVTANKVTITIIGENVIKDSTNYTVVNEEPDACLFIDSDLSINGSGSITVTGNYGDAIRCKKDLKLVSGNVIILSAVQRGIKAKNSICIKDGTVDVTSSNSGIKVTRDDNSNKGYIVIDGGNIAISSGKDALHAETHLTINNGYIDIKNCSEGIEGQMIDILGGEIHVLATDDGINASKISNTDNKVTDGMNGGMNGGMNDGMNDGMGGGINNNMKGGMDNRMPSNSSSSSDGSVYINIVGGKTYVTVKGNDVDGIDSNGVLYIGGEAEVYTCIEGGDVYGNMAALDADGNNDIIAGATVIALGGSNNGMGGGKMSSGNMGDNKMNQGNMNNGNFSPNNGNTNSTNINSNAYPPMKRQAQQPIDYPTTNTNTTINDDMSSNAKSGNMDGGMGKQRGPGGPGGPGGMGGMGETGSVYQPYIQASVNSQEAGSQIIVKDNNDKVIITFTPEISYSSILITTPSIVAGQEYTIVTGSNSITAVASEAATGSVNPPSVTSPTDTLNSSSSSDSYSIKSHLLSTIVIIAILILF